MIPIFSLVPHPDNANRMPAELFTKLVSHIAATGDYPPIIVRPLATEPATFQILDGHHRVQALKQLGHAEVKCDIWQADDDRAALLLLTLNRLQGMDDPVKRAHLLQRLASKEDLKALEAKLPESAAAIEKLLALCEAPPPPAAPQSIAAMPHAVTFFLSGTQRERLFARLRAVCADRTAALVALLNLDGDAS